MSTACHIPAITITECLPTTDTKITDEKYLALSNPWTNVDLGVVSEDESSAADQKNNKPNYLSIQKFGSSQNLSVDSRCTTPDSECGQLLGETSPLLGGRKKSFGYKDKKFDDDVPMAPNFYNEDKKLIPTKWFKIIKIFILATLTIGCVVIYTTVADHSESLYQYSVSPRKPINVSLKSYNIKKHPLLLLSLIGPFFLDINGNSSKKLKIAFRSRCQGKDIVISEQYVGVIPDNILKTLPESEQYSQINIQLDTQNKADDSCDLYVALTTNYISSFPVIIKINDLTENANYGVIYAAAILVGLYLLIIFEIIHRTLAAMLAATAAISVLSTMNEKPPIDEIINWIDIETLCLLFGMMVMVAILCETGFFDYLAVFVYRIARGRVWPLLTLLCLATAVVSAFLDNVTTILLLTPVTIRLSEVMNLNPKYVLIALVIFSNVGGTATAVGDPPNVIIVSDADIKDAGIEFTNFTIHMSLGVIFILAVTYGCILLMYRSCIKLTLEDHPEIAELKQEIHVWKRAAKSVSLYSRDEEMVRKTLLRKVAALENKLKKKLYNTRPNEDDYRASLLELERNYKIKDWPLLMKTGFVLFCVIVMFFLHSIVPGMNISLGWIALMGAILLLVLADLSDVEHLFSWVEWSTLIFFAALFVVMEALTKMGLLEAIGGATENFILGLQEEMRLPASIILVLWVSAIASSFIDNIPFTTVMLKIVLKLGQNPSLGLPLQPLVWALAFGACLGGNGTLIGASANVVCAGVAEQHGYRFTFLEFFKVGFPIMLITTFTSMLYLLVCHVALDWNDS